MVISPPVSIAELEERLTKLAGQSVSGVAHQLACAVPANTLHEKGWLGQIVEKYLGADAGSKAVADFQKLKIELKTLPINYRGEPAETTFVASINLKTIIKESWHTSLVRKKLQHVLWLPIEADADIPLKHRRFGRGFFWRLSEEQETALKKDWQELVDMLVLGQLSQVSAKLGSFLQIRPKARDGKSLCDTFDEHGWQIRTLPRGFYLRRSFTRLILEQAIGSNG